MSITPSRSACFALSLLALHPLPAVRAATLHTLKSFASFGEATGGSPTTPMVRGPDGSLYGITPGQGHVLAGTLFRLDPGGGLSVLKVFTNADRGGQPEGLALSGDTLFGTRRFGTTGFGMIFRIGTDGSGYSVVREFQSSLEGGFPSGPLAVSGGTLFGTTGKFGARYTGRDEGGTIYRLNTDGSGFAVLHSFSGAAGEPGDGMNPQSGLLLSGDKLYGTAPLGGNHGAGTVFRIGTDGSGFEVLRHFSPLADDGGMPAGPIAINEGVLFGATQSGGNLFGGTLYRMKVDGSDFAILHHFGEFPDGGLTPGGIVLAADGNLYGATQSGNGAAFFGTLFRAGPDGSGFSVVKFFDFQDSIGLQPMAGLTAGAGSVFGTTASGGSDGLGTIFEVPVPGGAPELLASFRSLDFSAGAQPTPEFVHSEGRLYGISYGGGNWHLFQLSTSGESFANVSSRNQYFPHSPLAVVADDLYWLGTRELNDDHLTVCRMPRNGADLTIVKELPPGMLPGGARLVASGSTLYGTKASGSDWQLFRLNADGTGFSILRTFTGIRGLSSLTVVDSTIFGTTLGLAGHGTVFKIGTGGSGFATLVQFNGVNGSQPAGRLVLRGSPLFGTTQSGGAGNLGTVYRVQTNGTGFASLASFSGDDGGTPEGGLVMSGNTLYGSTSPGTRPTGGSYAGTIFSLNPDTGIVRSLATIAGAPGRVGELLAINHSLYGTTQYAGEWGFGSVFQLDLKPLLEIIRNGPSVILSWPSDATEFDLESSQDPLSGWSPFTGNIVNQGLKRTVTIPISAHRQFFRLHGR